MADTRKHKRAPVSMRVRFKSATVDEFIEQYSTDISRGGIFIKSKSPMSVGTLLKFEFQLKDQSRLIHGVGRVVWQRDPSGSTEALPPGMGIKFIKMDPESRGLVQQIVDQRGDSPGSFEEGTEKSSSSGSFFPESAPAVQPAPEDRTAVRHASEFLQSALGELEPVKPPTTAGSGAFGQPGQPKSNATATSQQYLQRMPVGIAPPSRHQKASAEPVDTERASSEKTSSEKTASYRTTPPTWGQPDATPPTQTAAEKEPDLFEPPQAVQPLDDELFDPEPRSPSIAPLGSLSLPPSATRSSNAPPPTEDAAIEDDIADELASILPGRSRRAGRWLFPLVSVVAAAAVIGYLVSDSEGGTFSKFNALIPDVEEPSGATSPLERAEVSESAEALNGQATAAEDDESSPDTSSADEATADMDQRGSDPVQDGARYGVEEPTFQQNALPAEAPTPPDLEPDSQVDVRVTVNVGGAEILVGGVVQTHLPGTVALPIGKEIEISVRAPGYRTISRSVIATSRQPALRFRLEQLRYVLRVHTKPDNAQVQVDGRMLRGGQIQFRLSRRRAARGQVSLVAMAPGFRRLSESIPLTSFVDDGTAMQHSISLELTPAQPRRAAGPMTAAPRVEPAESTNGGSATSASRDNRPTSRESPATAAPSKSPPAATSQPARPTREPSSDAPAADPSDREPPINPFEPPANPF
ncbi:MAG: TIGR02266 family protein [Myxococcota bacterium]